MGNEHKRQITTAIVLNKIQSIQVSEDKVMSCGLRQKLHLDNF